MKLFEKVYEKNNYYIIKGFPIVSFTKVLRKHYETIKITRLFTILGLKLFKNGTITIHKFFLPELVYLLRKFNYPEDLVTILIENTWIKSVELPVMHDRIQLNNITKDMKVKLYPHQQEFVSNYDIFKQRYQLNGYVLGDSPGAGKTITSLALMTALNKKKVIIIAPKSTLITVWKSHIEKFFNAKKHIVVVNKDVIDPAADFFIFNYESLAKTFVLIKSLSKISETVGCIVDESHNFLKLKSNRTTNLIKLREELKITDMLLMSGTPIKAAGYELIPMLMLLDKYFDTEAAAIFKMTFGVNTTIASDVLKSRLNTMMHRNDKNKILKLPERFEETIKISIDTGEQYTVSAVKEAVKQFTDERLKYHNNKMEEYISEFNTVIRYISTTSIGKSTDFYRYVQLVTEFSKTKINMFDEITRLKVSWVNNYEKKTIRPLLTRDLRKKFDHCKSAIKYIHLKILGEIIGRLLMGLRIKMTTEMVKNSPIKRIIDEGIKKTIIFTSYVDTLEHTTNYLKEIGYQPLEIYGKTSKYIKSILDDFREIPKYNPLLASIKTIATGVTLIEANQMIFLNKPWRSVDFIQASDRVHRIGQDTPVYIYSFILDTGDEDNLSTRMDSIMEWSRQMFADLVTDDTTHKT